MQKTTRWLLVLAGLLALAALAVVIVVVFALGTERVPGNAVLTVRVAGELVDHDTRSPLEQLLTGEIDTLPEIVGSIERAAKDPRIRGLELRVGVLDLGWGRAQELRAALATFRKANKPIYAHIEAGRFIEYYLASVANKVWLTPAGMLMPTGLLADASFYKGTLAKLGIQADLEHIGE